VVYAKPCLDATLAVVVQYLARYSHKIALTDHRLVGMDDQTVSFRYTDYRDDRREVMTLASEEVLRCFLLHILPKGLMRIRHYGYLANRCRRAQLARIRSVLDQAPANDGGAAEHESQSGSSAQALELCPRCGKKRLQV
jgi:hypothetical protein